MQETRKCRLCGVEPIVPPKQQCAGCSRLRANEATRLYLARKREADPRLRLVGSAKERAVQCGLQFAITVDDVFIPEVCPALGIPLVRARGRGPAYNSPTLDRFDSSVGYVPGNVFVISALANRIKNNATTEQVGRVHAWMLEVERMRSQASFPTATTSPPT